MFGECQCRVTSIQCVMDGSRGMSTVVISNAELVLTQLSSAVCSSRRRGILQLLLVSNVVGAL